MLARARVLADLSRNAEAEPLLAQALAQDRDNEDGLALFSRVLVAGRRFREAEAVDERLLRAHPDSLRGLTSMARVKCLLGRKLEGVPFARRAVELYPDQVTALTTLADVLQQVTHGSAEALELLRRAREIDPDWAFAYRLTGEIHLDLAHYAEAETWLLRAAMADAPDEGYPAAELALLLVSAGRWPEAEAVLAPLSLNLPDASRLLHPCLLIAARIMTEHVVSMVGTLEETLEEEGQPSPEFLAECAHWLDLLVRMLTLGVTGHPETARKALRVLPQAVDFLREVPGAPGSEFAGAVQGLGALLESHGLMTPEARGA
jgi:predicted Zn-dependent protease